MRTVEDETGRRFLLEKEARESWLVRDPATGERRHLPADRLSVVDGQSPLETAGAAVPDAVVDRLALPSARAVGLLAEIHRRGPVRVRVLLAAYDLCESDLHGLLGEFAAADLVRETEVGGERAYETTDAIDWA